MQWHPPQLRRTGIMLTTATPVADPAAFLRASVGDEAMAVIEGVADVRVVPLSEVVFDAGTLQVHAFDPVRQAQARVGRSGSVWVGDSVREVRVDEPGSIEAWGRPGRHLCLGRAKSDGAGTVMREARIRPYRLPIPLPEGHPAEVEFVDYHVVDDAAGTMSCVGHRVIAIRGVKGV